MTYCRTLLNEPTQAESMASNVTRILPVSIHEAPKTIKESSTPLNILQNVKEAKTLRHNHLQDIIGPYPFSAPPGFQWKPKWELCPVVSSAINTNSIPTSTSAVSKSFEELFLDKVKTFKTKTKKRTTNVSRAQVMNLDNC